MGFAWQWLQIERIGSCTKLLKFLLQRFDKIVRSFDFKRAAKLMCFVDVRLELLDGIVQLFGRVRKLE